MTKQFGAVTCNARANWQILTLNGTPWCWSSTLKAGTAKLDGRTFLLETPTVKAAGYAGHSVPGLSPPWPLSPWPLFPPFLPPVLPPSPKHKRTHMHTHDTYTCKTALAQVFHLINDFIAIVMLALLSIDGTIGNKTDNIRFALWGSACVARMHALCIHA